jgi:hypothetical protein
MAARKKLQIGFLVISSLAFIFLVSLSVSASDFSMWTSMSSNTTSDLHSIWGVTSTDVFAIGNSGTIIHYDGSKWASMSSNTTDDLHSIWGATGTDVFAVGSSGTIIHYDGSTWSSISSNTTNDLHSVWGATGTDVFAAGSSGIILHYDGSTWSSISSNTTNDLHSIWGVTSTDVFAVGSSGMIIHYDGSTWALMSSNTTDDLHSIWGTTGTDVFAVGSSGTIIHYDGSSWASMISRTTSDLHAVWGVAGTDVFAGGNSGTIIHYDGSTWASMNRNTTSDLHGMWGFSSSDVFAAGWAGTIMRYIPPSITSISPDQGDQGATLNVTIAGTNLTGASEVRFGTGIAVNSFTFLSSNQISANITIVTGATIGARDVSVTTSGGSFTLLNSFTVKQALPMITSVSPDQGRQGVTLSVTITGTNLTGANEVRFGTGIAVNSFTVLSPNQISASIIIIADAVTGTRDVSVITTGGSFTLPNSFTVKQALPTITSVSPDQGNQETTLGVTIAGTNLTGASEVRFGTGIAVNSFTILSSNQISASITIVTGSAIGTRDVSVTTPGGSFVLPNSFTVKQALPTITSVSPDQGSQGATLSVTITGTNLTGTSEVRFGTGIVVNSFTILSSNKISANIIITADAEIEARDVSVTTPGGSFALPNSFTVKQALPAITSISPDQGSRGTTLVVIISGSKLSGATAVSFGTGVVIKSFTNLSPTQITVNVMIDKEAVTGARDVSVTTPGGSSTLGGSFYVKEKPLGTLIVALIWVGIALVVVILILILNVLRKKRAAKF